MKDKAKELVDKHYAMITGQPFLEQVVVDKNSIKYFKAKQCALICATEVLKTLGNIEGQQESLYREEKEWIELKQQIEKL